MPNERQKWSGLNNTQKHEKVQKVIEKAAWNEEFHGKCMDPRRARTAIEDETEVTFDDDVEVRCFKDKPSAEKQVLILLPPLVPQAEKPAATPPADKAFWMCTYPTYNPTR